MKNLPNWFKWVLVLAAMAGMAWLMLAINDRASRVKMPDPDDMYGKRPTASSAAEMA